jgi:hypothetical protein
VPEAGLPEGQYVHDADDGPVMRRFLVAVLVLALIATTAVLLTGCGASLNPLSHVASTVGKHHRALHAALCAFHGWRAVTQLLHHHPLWSAYHAWRAAHHCGRAL